MVLPYNYRQRGFHTIPLTCCSRNSENPGAENGFDNREYTTV